MPTLAYGLHERVVQRPSPVQLPHLLPRRVRRSQLRQLASDQRSGVQPRLARRSVVDRPSRLLRQRRTDLRLVEQCLRGAPSRTNLDHPGARDLRHVLQHLGQHREATHASAPWVFQQQLLVGGHRPVRTGVPDRDGRWLQGCQRPRSRLGEPSIRSRGERANRGCRAVLLFRYQHHRHKDQWLARRAAG